jgi:hypothetical protein
MNELTKVRRNAKPEDAPQWRYVGSDGSTGQKCIRASNLIYSSNRSGSV